MKLHSGILLAAMMTLGMAPWGEPAEARTLGVFIALADNASQGIVPVPAAIGNGGDPERNLYWGTAEGLRGVFDKSREWRLLGQVDATGDPDVLRIRTYQHIRTGSTLIAKAYRGSAIRRCLRDFETAIQTGAFNLAVFIGHNGLMDFELPLPPKAAPPAARADCIVLCCRSEAYFRNRIEHLGGRPVLLTTQLMYPGAFLLHAAAGVWLAGGSPAAIRERAGEAYAENQKLSKKAGLGVFAPLTE